MVNRCYDGDGNISSLETRAGENILLSFAYQYDGNGNRTAKAGTQARAALGGISSEITEGNNALDIFYSYDVRGQLLEERRNGATVRYAYDKAGNRIRKTDAQGEPRYFYNGKNQLITEEGSSGRKQFTYDRQGGIVKERNAAGIRLFSYNSRHQQTKVETESGEVQENRYDVEGLRFELLENGHQSSFVYHNGELLYEEGREKQKTSYHLGVGIDAFQRGQELYYYQQDEQLSTALVTNGRSEIQNSYLYDAFGAEMAAEEQSINRIRYTGQQYDEITEQYYLRARHYNPVLGRFMQEDVYQGDGLNLYAYCHNNPVVYYDPSGYAGIPQTSHRCPPNGHFGEEDNGETELFLPDEYYQKLDEGIAKAIESRDAEVARIQGLSKTQQKNITTVVAGVDIRTGDVCVGVKDSIVYKGNATCAEDIVFRGLGGNTNANIIMTPAIRPRNNEVVPVCVRCQTKYPHNQFAKGTTFE